MTRWDALTAICSYLRGGLLGDERKPEGEIIWELMIEVASFHFVTPALARCFDSNANIPPEVRDYFEGAAALNGKRNKAMLSSLTRVAALLNAVDIEPILLKGAAHVVDGTYPDPALRILGDIDVLIPAGRATDAVMAMRAAGFAAKAADVVPPPDHHHLPMLHEAGTDVGVELHTDVIDPSPDHAISTAWFCETTRPVSLGNQRVRLPDPTRNCAHTIFHSQVFHEQYARNKIHLRHLLDLALIRARHEGAIDWSEVDHRFSAAGHGEVVATYLDFSRELFGQPAPKLRHAPRRDAMAELRATESRNSFQVQIEHLKSVCDRLQTDLSAMTVSRDHFHSEAQRLERVRDALQTDLSGMIASRDHFRSKAERLERARDHFRSEAERLERALAQVTSSRSWWLTGPLRAIGRWLR